MVPKSNHTIVRTPEQFQTMMNRIACAQAVSIDHETDGIAWYKHARSCGIALAVWDHQGVHSFYTPYRHQTGEKQLPFSAVSPALKWIYEHPTMLKVGHHLKFEDHIGRREGWKLNGPRYDTSVGAHLYNENEFIALKHRAKIDLRIADADAWDSALDVEITRMAKAQKLGKDAYRAKYGYAQVPIELAGFYACHDADFAAQLMFLYEKQGISTYYDRIWRTEMGLTEVLCDMEETGLPLNVAYLQELQDSLDGVLAGLDSQIQPLLPRPTKLSSDDQLREYLTEDLHLRLWKTTKSGALAVDREVLEEYEHIPQIALWMRWREAEKLRNTYTESLLEHMDLGMVLHGGLRQNGTETGRMSSSEPNLQNFPTDNDDRAKAFSGKPLKKGGIDPWSIRRAFTTRGKGWVRLFFDYSQIELRVLAKYTQDPIMVAAYLNDEDIHLRTQIEVFEDDDKDSPKRRVAKIINFGLSYCLTEQGLARQAKIPLPEAQRFMGRFNERYHGIIDFRTKFWEGVRGAGGYFNNMWGRTRRVPDINSYEGWKRARAERQAIGALIQGTAAELTKESLVRIHRRFKAEGLPAHLVTVIHDDIQADTPVEYLAPVARIMREEMERFPEFSPIPIKVDGQYTVTNWAEKHALPLS